MTAIKRHTIESKTVKLHCKVTRLTKTQNIEIVIDKVESKIANHVPLQIEVDELIAALKDTYDTTNVIIHETNNTSWENSNKQ